jgi:hypothetical protein
VAFQKPWAGFFARHTERHPNGVIAGLLNDWQTTRTDSRLTSLDPGLPLRTHNSDVPRRIAQLLADKLRQRRP